MKAPAGCSGSSDDRRVIETPPRRPGRPPWWRPHLSAPRRPSVPARLLAILSVLGPGLVAGSAGNDAGGIATYASIGAQYGYELLWVMVLLTVAMGVVQEMCARMGAATGQGFTDLVRAHLGVRWTLFVVACLLVANGGTIVSEFAGIAAASELFGVPRYVAVPPAAVLVWWLVVRGTYPKVERVFLAMTFVFFAYPVSAYLAHPDWGEAVRRAVVPSVHWDRDYLFLVVATIGTTITPYMQLYVQSAVAEKGIRLKDYAPQRLEVWGSAIFSDLVSAFIIIATAATLFLAGKNEVNDAADAARALAPLAGPYASA